MANITHGTWLVGDVFECLADIPSDSVDLVLTSPPFLGLRSYLPADHVHKANEIGTEGSPAEFIDTLLRLTVEWRRVLAPHGSLCVELGDSYSGSGGAGGDYAEGGSREGQPRFRQRSVPDGGGWPLAKSLAGIPHLYHLSLTYGRNVLRAPLSAVEMLDYFDRFSTAMATISAAEMLTMMRTWLAQRTLAGPPLVEIEPWRVRNVVAWCKPNPPVGALGDKFRPGTTYMTVAAMATDRYFDLDAVRGDPAAVKDQRRRNTNGPKQDPGRTGEVLTANYNRRIPSHPNGAPPLDWWEIPTHPYAGAHYAAWPEALCSRPIRSMCPLRVCETCGRPSRRIVDVTGLGDHNDRANGLNGKRPPMPEIIRSTTGWTDCGHDTWRRGIVLDPFAGSGTTVAAAVLGHGVDAIGIDIDPRNAVLARERVGMFLNVKEATASETSR